MTRLPTRWGTFLLALAVVPLLGAHAQESAREIIDRSDQLMRGETSETVYEMTVVRPDWSRTLSFHAWQDGTEKAFIRVLEPAKERGVAFLKLGREMWQYIPKVNRVIKIPPSMMLQSWMGSDFTNDDLVRESSIVEDYTHTLLSRDTLADGEAYRIEMIAKPEAPVAWDRVHYWVRVADYVPLRAEFFNERGERTRTIVYSDIKPLGGRTIPARMTLLEEKKEGHQTLLTLKEITFDEPMRASIFSQQNLRRAR